MGLQAGSDEPRLFTAWGLTGFSLALFSWVSPSFLPARVREPGGGDEVTNAFLIGFVAALAIGLGLRAVRLSRQDIPGWFAVLVGASAVVYSAVQLASWI